MNKFIINNIEIEYELCFDDFIKAKSIPLPPRVMEVYKACQAQSTTQVRCTTQIYPEANLVVLTVNQFLFLWQYYVNNNIDEYDASFELESKYNDKVFISVNILYLTLWLGKLL